MEQNNRNEELTTADQAKKWTKGKCVIIVKIIANFWIALSLQ